MSKTTLEETSYAWKQIAQNWEEYFFAPSRPSAEETANYLDWLGEIADGRKGLKALVLGSTPELRDALNQLRYATHSIDVNMEMIQALNELVTHKNTDEVLLRANWLDTPLKDDYFDVILGDAVFPNVPWESRDAFYEEICRMLKPGGHFLNRAFFAPDKKRFDTIDEVLDSFVNKVTCNQSAIEMVFEIQLLTHDRDDRLGSMEKVREVVEKLHSDDGFHHPSDNVNATLDIVWNYWLGSVSNKVWIYPSEAEEQAEYDNYFETVSRFTAKDHPYGELTPMFMLKLR